MWLHPEGREMNDTEWQQTFARCLGMFESGESPMDQSERGMPITDDDFIVLLNAHHEAIPFKIPAYPDSASWEVLIDTSSASGFVHNQTIRTGQSYPLQGRSAVLLIRQRRKTHHGEPRERNRGSVHRHYVMPFGAKVLEDGRVRFLIWAPEAERLELRLENLVVREAYLEMERIEGGWF